MERDQSQPQKLRRYLLDGEKVIVAVHDHPVTVVEPVVTAALSLLLVLWLTFVVADPLTRFPTWILWLCWFALVGRVFWRLYERSHTWFIATDRRLLKVDGALVHHVSMMPLGKVQDMRYDRSPLGHLLGYGTYVLESAGKEQALREIHWVPEPDANYREIIAHIFKQSGDEPPQKPAPRRPRWLPQRSGKRRWHPERFMQERAARTDEIDEEYGRNHRVATQWGAVSSYEQWTDEPAQPPAPPEVRDDSPAWLREREGESLYSAGPDEERDDDGYRDATGWWG